MTVADRLEEDLRGLFAHYPSDRSASGRAEGAAPGPAAAPGGGAVDAGLAIATADPPPRGVIPPAPPPERVFDEAIDSEGRLRPHWRGVIEWAGRAGPEGYEAVLAENRRLRLESGVAFDPAGASDAMAAAADAFPVVIAPEEWETISLGVAQRARLIEAALRDLYGPQTALKEGWLPPGLAFGNPDFALWRRDWPAQDAPWLTLFEMDLARGADGRWMVLADRVDSPLGDGWLIANRVAASQSFAEPFMGARVRRLAGHYLAFQQVLEDAMGPDGRVALMSGGGRDPRYFSHAYFARYLGAALIEPGDVTVRHGAAYVKTVEGLKPLSVLLRGVHSRHLDALFAPDEAAPGAPALSLAARSGRLRLANGLGSGAFAYRAMAPFAHILCERLLEEPLILHDAPCLWMGDAEAREQAMDEPELWRLERITRGPLTERGAPSLTMRDRDALARFLRRSGDRLAAVATPPLSTTPAWVDGALAPRQWMMRVFAGLTPKGWSVAPGGVATLVEPGCPPPPLAFGKDVWIPARTEDEARTAPTLERRLAGTHLRRTGGDLLSRVADDLFWLGRTTERADGTLRALRVVIDRMLSGQEEDESPEVLSAILEIQAGSDERRAGMVRVRDAIGRLTADPHEPMGIAALLSALRRTGQRVRPYLSEESWRSIDRLCSDKGWKMPPPPQNASALLRLIDDSLLALAAFAGATHENQTRNHVWRFLELGRGIERGLTFARAADALAGRRRDPDETWLRAWLTLLDSRSAYRTRYMTTPAPAPAVDLLILDERNPRSLVFQLMRLEEALERLPSPGPRRSRELRLAMRTLMEVRLADPEALAEEDEDGVRPRLRALIHDVREALAELSDELARSFFAHTQSHAQVQAHQRMMAPPESPA